MLLLLSVDLLLLDDDFDELRLLLRLLLELVISEYSGIGAIKDEDVWNSELSDVRDAVEEASETIGNVDDCDDEYVRLIGDSLFALIGDIFGLVSFSSTEYFGW